MKNFFKIILILIFIIPNVSQAGTLFESLQSAYLNNSKLNAERANMRASREEKREAISEFLPSVTISGYRKSQDNIKGNEASTRIKPKEQSILVEQKIFQGFGGVANLQKKRKGQQLGEFKLKKVEQEILLDAAKAHTELLLNKKKVNINLINVDLLERQVETDQNRLEKGEISLTDLAQSESSLAGAQAQFTQASNDLLISKLNYENIIGNSPNPNKLKKSSKAIVSIPNSLNSAIELSKKNNPDIKIAELDLVQSEKDLAISESDLKPTASLSLERSYVDDLSSTYDQREKDTLKATISWPFYSGGKKRSTISKNSNLTYRKRLLLEDAIKTNDTMVASAWSSLESSKSFLNSVIAQVRAAKIANEGISAEYERGSRTTLDVIQSNSLLLTAQISLANSERNYLMAQYNLLKSVGLLSSDYLKLK